MSSNQITDTYAAVADEDYLKISDGEGCDVMELPLEENGTIMLSTIQAQFPNTIGLKYKSSSGAWRGIRAVDNVLDPPRGGWGSIVYYVTHSEPLKRKTDDASNSHSQSKVIKPVINPLLQDIAVLGLPYQVTDEEFREYFSTNCGELAYSEVKFDRDTKRSRGFGFIRFKTVDAAEKAVKDDHFFMGRKVEIRPKKDQPMKIFVGRLPRGTTKETLSNYFSEYGLLKDAYIPSPFRGFGFITFASTEVGRMVLAMSHVIEGSLLNLEERKTDKSQVQNHRGNERGHNSTSRQSESDRYNPKSTQSRHNPPQADPASELKDMLFSFLLRQKRH